MIVGICGCVEIPKPIIVKITKKKLSSSLKSTEKIVYRFSKDCKKCENL